MKSRPDIHIVHDGIGGWRVIQGRRTLSRHRRQLTAVRTGMRKAKRGRVELVTHGRDGRIRSKDSYGNESSRRDTEH